MLLVYFNSFSGYGKLVKNHVSGYVSLSKPFVYVFLGYGGLLKTHDFRLWELGKTLVSCYGCLAKPFVYVSLRSHWL